MGQEGGEKWTAAADLQPTFPKSDRLLGARRARFVGNAMLRMAQGEASQAGLGLRVAAGAPHVDNAREPLFGRKARFTRFLRCRGVGLAVLGRTHCPGT